MAFGMESSNPFMLQRLRRRYEGQPEEPEVPDLSPEAMPGLQKPVTQSTPRMSEAEKYFEAMKEVMNNRPARGAYLAAMADTPDPSQYQPSKWRRLAAAVAGGAMGATGQAAQGIEAAETINRAPYAGAMEQWQSRLKPTQVAAQMEQQNVEEQLGLLTGARDFGLDYKKYLASTAHQERQDETAARRVKAYEQYVNNPDYQGRDVPGGVLYVNQKNPRETHLVPGKTLAQIDTETRQGHLGVAQGQLGVAQTNAQTNRTNAETAQARQRTYASFTNEAVTNMREQRRLQEKGLDIRQDAADTAATNAALEQMHSDPRFTSMIEWDEDLGGYIVDPEVSQEDYNDVMEAAEEIAGVTERRGRRTRPTPKTPRSYVVPGVD